MASWKLGFEVWPFSGVAQELAGERKQTAIIYGDDFAEATKNSAIFIRGVRSNPAVWEAPITSLVKHADGGIE